MKYISSDMFWSFPPDFAEKTNEMAIDPIITASLHKSIGEPSRLGENKKSQNVEGVQ